MKTNFFKNGKLPGKSTAAVICFSLAAVAALGIFSYNRSAEKLENSLSGISDNSLPVTEQTAPETPADEPAKEADAPAEVPFTEAAAPQETIMLEQDAFGAAEPDESSAAVPTAESEVLTDAVIKPVSGDIINQYSDGELVKSKTLNVWKTHDGIDIAADAGTVVKSITSGTVSDVVTDPLMGVTVIIDHGSGYEGYYCNLSDELQIKEGDTVSAGTVIGTVGTTAEAEIAEEDHLHLGLKKNGSWTDPAVVLSGEGS